VSAQDDLYERAAAEYGAALGRLARGYEAEPEKRRELLQVIHIALWRSFEGFEARCSLRTWVYRVAHNTAASWVIQQRRERPEILVGLEELDQMPAPSGVDRQMALDRLTRSGS
jgi:RNA polymerase sigma-70 factor, ECF subfamily